MAEILLKKKYRTYSGKIRRGAPIGNGDSGKHKRKKLPEKMKRQLAPQTPRVLVYDAGRGKGLMQDA